MMSKEFEMILDQLVLWQRAKPKGLPLRDVFVPVKLLSN
jgi:hypothetical protein